MAAKPKKEEPENNGVELDSFALDADLIEDGKWFETTFGFDVKVRGTSSKVYTALQRKINVSNRKYHIRKKEVPNDRLHVQALQLVCDALLVDWKRLVKGEEAKPIPCNPEWKNKILGSPRFRHLLDEISDLGSDLSRFAENEEEEDLGN